MDLSAAVTKYKKVLVNIGVIAVALIISGKIYQQQNKTMETLRLQKEDFMKENETLKEISIIEKRINLYAVLLNKKDPEAVINSISNIARATEIKINSIKPLGQQRLAEYTKLPFELVITAPSYHALGKFINRIESYEDVYIVEALSVNLNEQEEQLNASLKITTVMLK